MADQILTPEGETPAPVDPFVPQEVPLLSEQMGGTARPGGSFEERALQQIRGTGPHVTTGGRVDRMIGTAGRMNQLTHGMQGPEATSGAQARNQLIGARQARDDPYRDTLHYRKDFGVALSDTVHTQATQQQKDFHNYIADTNRRLNEVQQQLNTDKVNVEQAYSDQQKAIQDSYNTEMDKLPEKTTLRDSYSSWLRTDNDPVWVMSGSGPDNPGNEEGVYRLQKSQLESFFQGLVDGGTPVAHNRIYVSGRGQEVHDQLQDGMLNTKTEYYKQQAPIVAQNNAAIDTAISTYATQRNTLLGAAQLDYSNATTKIAEGEGAVAGRREGLGLEVNANKQDLAEVRKSYTDRLSRIDETLRAMVQGGGNSRSEATPMRQIDPRMPSAQQEQPA